MLVLLHLSVQESARIKSAGFVLVAYKPLEVSVKPVAYHVQSWWGNIFFPCLRSCNSRRLHIANCNFWLTSESLCFLTKLSLTPVGKYILHQISHSCFIAISESKCHQFDPKLPQLQNPLIVFHKLGVASSWFCTVVLWCDNNNFAFVSLCFGLIGGTIPRLLENASDLSF